MWLCECGYKNPPANQTCHGVNCSQKKPTPNIFWKTKKTKVRDYCPNCKSYQDFTRFNVKKNRWSCHKCKRLTKMTSEPNPEPKTVIAA